MTVIDTNPVTLTFQPSGVDYLRYRAKNAHLDAVSVELVTLAVTVRARYPEAATVTLEPDWAADTFYVTGVTDANGTTHDHDSEDDSDAAWVEQHWDDVQMLSPRHLTGDMGDLGWCDGEAGWSEEDTVTVDVDAVLAHAAPSTPARHGGTLATAAHAMATVDHAAGLVNHGWGEDADTDMRYVRLAHAALTATVPGLAAAAGSHALRAVADQVPADTVMAETVTILDGGTRARYSTVRSWLQSKADQVAVTFG